MSPDCRPSQLPWSKQFVRDAVYRSARISTVHGVAQDAFDRVRFGPGALRVGPALATDGEGGGTVWWSARVACGAWATTTERPIDGDPFPRPSVARQVDGLPWENPVEMGRIRQSINHLETETDPGRDRTRRSA